jgi:hypothetical protein
MSGVWNVINDCLPKLGLYSITHPPSHKQAHTNIRTHNPHAHTKWTPALGLTTPLPQAATTLRDRCGNALVRAQLALWSQLDNNVYY